MSTEIARIPAGIVPLTMDELERAMHMAGRAAGAQAALQIMVGQAAGLSIGQCLTDVHMVSVGGQIKPTLSATAQLSLARRAGVRTRWIEASDTAAELELSPPGDDPTRWRVTIEDARRAEWATGKNAATWAKHPGAMLRARAITRGIRAACPEVLGGMSLYDPDEIGDSTPFVAAAVATVAATAVAEQAQPRAHRVDPRASDVVVAPAAEQSTAAQRKPAPGAERPLEDRRASAIAAMAAQGVAVEALVARHGPVESWDSLVLAALQVDYRALKSGQVSAEEYARAAGPDPEPGSDADADDWGDPTGPDPEPAPVVEPAPKRRRAAV